MPLSARAAHDEYAGWKRICAGRIVRRMVYKVWSFKKPRQKLWEEVEPTIRKLVKVTNEDHPTRPLVRVSGEYVDFFVVEQFESRVQLAEWEEGSTFREVKAKLYKELADIAKKLDVRLLEGLKTEFFVDTMKGFEDA